MLIKSYGLFWRKDEIEWHPGKGKRGEFRLLGRRYWNRPGLRLVDVRWMQGIYILYGEYGPYYVGLTREQGLGKRLRDHLVDGHAGLWDRFSWFGFQKVLESCDDTGIRYLGKLATVRSGTTDNLIGDTEALLIKAMGLSNKRDMNFAEGTGWAQVRLHEKKDLLAKAVSVFA